MQLQVPSILCRELTPKNTPVYTVVGCLDVKVRNRCVGVFLEEFLTLTASFRCIKGDYVQQKYIRVLYKRVYLLGHTYQDVTG